MAHITDAAQIDETILGEYMLNIRTQSREEIGGAVI